MKTQKPRIKPVKTNPDRPGRNGGRLNTGGSFPGAGRPQGKSRKTRLNEILDVIVTQKEYVNEASNFGISNPSVFDMVILGQVISALQGNPNSAKLLLDYSGAKLPEELEITERKLTPNEIAAELLGYDLTQEKFD